MRYRALRSDQRPACFSTFRCPAVYVGAASVGVAACHASNAIAGPLSYVDLGDNYADHEVHQDEGLIVFQTNADVWVGRLDACTGLFVAGAGREWRVAQNASPLQISRNGPEFGIDADGWSIFYNTNVGPRVLIDRAVPLGGFGSAFEVETLTDLALDRVNQLPSQNPGAATTYVTYGLGVPGTLDRDIAYLDDAAPNADRLVTALSPGTAGFRWAKGTSFMTSTIGDVTDFGEVVLVDADSDERKVITKDAGVKFDPFAWLAPEFGGSLMMIATLEERDLAVYRQAEPYWEQVAVLSPPPESGMSYIQSAEPFVAAGRSFVVLTLKNAEGPVFGGNVTESQIWLYGIDDNPATRFAMRIDDPSSPHLVRHEGEAFLADTELLVYYNDLRPGGVGLRMTRTGIRLDLPVECQPADVAPPFGVLTTGDLLRTVGLVDNGAEAGDLNGSGSTDFFDVLDQLAVFDGCGPEGP